MKTKKLLISLGIGIIATIVMAGTSKAGLQSRPNAKSLRVYNSDANYFFSRVRKMEASGGVLGLNAIIDETTFLDSSNNGLDIHMAKNTEWGTAAILSASSYGSAPTGKSTESTTGNLTGIYQMADSQKEFVAGISKGSNIFRNKDGRYYDLYEDNIAKVGDATYETAGWKNSSFTFEMSPNFIRSNSSLFGIFDYYATSDYFGARAVVVCGEGIQ